MSLIIDDKDLKVVPTDKSDYTTLLIPPQNRIVPVGK